MGQMKNINLARQLGQAARSRRRELGLTQQQLADAAGVSRGFVVRLERGDSVAMYPQKLIDLLHALGLDLLVAPQSSFDTPAPDVETVCADAPEAAPQRKPHAPDQLLQIDERLLRARRERP